MYTLLPPGGIASIDEPRFVTAEQADELLEPEEPMLAVIGADGTGKASSTWHLDGEPIAVTW